MYENAEVPPPVYGDWSKSIEDVPQGFASPTYNLNGVNRFSAELIRDCRRAYYALITQIDYNLGVLFARLRELGLQDNTTIIFTSDHGELLGDHNLGAKSVFFEGSAHVPMLIRPAANLIDKMERGSRCDELVCLADILTTCTAAAGVEVPADAKKDGLDLLAVARGALKRAVFHGECGDFFCVIEGHYKYIFTSNGAAELLFDLKSDPYEQRELIRGGQHADVLKRLRGSLIERLGAQGNPAVKDGKLVAVRQPQSAREVRANSWPGYHSRARPDEVLH
jgi:arylsulfatase A-like enzyme